MNRLLVSVALALTSSSCAPPCQEFYSLTSDVGFAKLGLGQPHSLVIGGGEGPLRVTGLPPGMSVSASGKIRLTGTPTEVGTFDLDVRPGL